MSGGGRQPSLLRCRYGHTWRVLKQPELRFTDKSERFCRVCLEERRVEVASIQVEAALSLGGVARAWCFACQRDTLIPLLPDWTAGVSFLAGVGSLDDAVRARWYHLPERWPTCSHCGEPTADDYARVGTD